MSGVPLDRLVTAGPGGPPPSSTVRSLTPDVDPSAEMEALRLKRVRRAFAGPGVDEGGPSPLTKGLFAGSILGVMAVLVMGVAGLIGATWEAREREERQRTQPTTTVPTTVTPTTRTAPAVVPPPSTTVPTTRRGTTTRINA
jgi:hypothetical protein